MHAHCTLWHHEMIKGVAKITKSIFIQNLADSGNSKTFSSFTPDVSTAVETANFLWDINISKSCIDIQIYDLVQAFYALWLADCMNDLYDTIPAQQRDKKLDLMYEGNKTTVVAVNTPVGQTQRVKIGETVQQGGVFGPIMCSNTIDKVGQKCYNRGENLYL